MKHKPKVIVLTAVLMLFAFTPIKESNTIKAAMKMQDFVIDISKYARTINPDFIVIPQNGAELPFEKTDTNSQFNATYMNAIDGIAVEDLFYHGKPKVDNYRLQLLRKIQKEKKVLVSDFVTQDEAIAAVQTQSAKEDFLLFPRSKNNMHYREIPDSTPNENANDILKLSDAKNYLYLINPSDIRTKKAFIKAIADTNFDLVVLDLFFNGEPLTTKDVAQMKMKANGGQRLLLSYVNIGAAENWRYYWKHNYKLNSPVWLKKKYAGYVNEIYVQFWHEDWKKIIYGNPNSYVKKITDAGFDGAFLDNVEAYYFLYNK